MEDVWDPGWGREGGRRPPPLMGKVVWVGVSIIEQQVGEGLPVEGKAW